MTDVVQTYMKTFIVAIVMTMLLAGVFGLGHLGMNTATGGSAGPCPFMPGVAICNMTAIQHIAAAQNMFTSLPGERNILSALLLIALAFLVSSFARQIVSPSQERALVSIALRLHTRGYNSLQTAYARGILNAKVF